MGLQGFQTTLIFAKSSAVLCDNVIDLILFLLAMNFYDRVDEETPLRMARATLRLSHMFRNRP